MNDLYTFLFCIALGIVARILYIASTALAKRTNIFPVTVVLDVLVCLIVGAAFAAYVIIFGVTLAPYMFAALAAGYFFTYKLTTFNRPKKVKSKSEK